jgi:hypothetical protein
MNRRLVVPTHSLGITAGGEKKKSCLCQELNPKPSRTCDSHNTDRATLVLRVQCCSQHTMTGHLNGRHLTGGTTTQQSQQQPGQPDSGPTLWTLNLNNKKPDCDIHWQRHWILTQAVCDILSPSKYIQRSYSMWQPMFVTLCGYSTTNVGGQPSSYVNMINECIISGIWQMSVKVMTLYQHSTVTQNCTNNFPPHPSNTQFAAIILTLFIHHPYLCSGTTHQLDKRKNTTSTIRNLLHTDLLAHTLNMPKRKLLSQGSDGRW